MKLDIIYDSRTHAYWIVDQKDEEWIAGPFLKSADAERELAHMIEPENDDDSEEL